MWFAQEKIGGLFSLGIRRALGAGDEEIDGSRMCGPAVLKDEDALPGSQGHLPVDDWDHFTRPSQGHAQMTRGIVGTFESMNVVARLWAIFSK